MLRTYLLLAAIIIAPVLSSCDRKSEKPAEDGFQSSWKNEEHWMVDLVVKNLASMVRASGKDLPKVETSATDTAHQFKAGSSEIRLSPSCWDMASYAPLLAEWKPTSGEAGAEDLPLVETLLSPTVETLQKANISVSRALVSHPSDPAMHESAAFLLGVLAIRENARGFSDLRPLLCRMTAHLAYAEALRNGSKSGEAGALALVLHELHAGRPKEALRRAEMIPDEGASGRWKRTVKLLITGDWRRGEDLEAPSLVELIAQARALKLHRGNPTMIEFLQEHEELQKTPEWSRLIAGPGRSVDEGHVAMRSAIPMEFVEINAVFPVGENPEPGDLAKHFTDEAGDFTGKDVISNADWAAYFRRHVFAAAADVSRFAIRSWGAMDAAAEWEETILPYCEALKGHESVAPLVAVDSEVFQKRLAITRDSILARPERMPVALWYDYRFPALDCGVEIHMPDQVPWFREVSPPGTAHDPTNRIRYTGIHGADWVKHIKSLHEISPWNGELCFELAENSGNNAATVKAAWGELSDYSVKPMKQLLQTPSLTADERIDILRKYAEIDPEKALELGADLVITGRDEEAIKAYENAFENATDRVAVANRSQWMIHHYKKVGLDAAARKIANHNAEVYSSRGLESAMSLAFLENRHSEALKIAHQINERYGSPYMPVIAQWAAGTDAKASKALFPEGEKKVTLKDLETADNGAGLRISEQSTVMRLNDLQAGETIVAVDGTLVKTYPQYLAMMCRSLEPKVTFIVRRGKNLREAHCVLPGRRIDSDLVPVQ